MKGLYGFDIGGTASCRENRITFWLNPDDPDDEHIHAVAVDATNDDCYLGRIMRIHRVAGVLYAAGVLHAINELYDRKGCLAVKWNCKPPDFARKAVEDVWGGDMGDACGVGTSLVSHEIVENDD